MTLQDLIDQLTALQPASARDAIVMAADVHVETAIVSVGYADGIVTIRCEDLDANGDYDDGYEDGKRDGKREAEDDD